MPKYAEPESSQELRDAIRRVIAQSGLTEAEASRRLGYNAPSQLNRRLNEGKPTFSREEIERICEQFRLDPEMRIELLRLRGDVVFLQPDEAPQVVAIEDLPAQLAPLMSDALRAELHNLPELIADALRGVLPWEDLRTQLGRSALVSFDHARANSISIGDVAGRDVIRIGTLQLALPPPPPPLDPFALLEQLPTGATAPIPSADTFAVASIPHRIELLPNELFTGRDTDLRSLATTLKAGGGVVVTTGMGGVGKTQLAVEFAHRYGRYFAGGVFWINCADPGAIEREIAAAGGPGGLDLPGFAELPLDEQVRRIKHAWQQPIPRMLIFDNCEDERLILRHRLPTGGCRVLVTSRRQQWSGGQRLVAHELTVLDRAASSELLCRLANRDDPQRLSPAQADPIAAAPGDLPLALHLAGSFLARSSKDPAGFLADLTRRHLEHPALRGRPDTLVPTYSMLGREIGLYTVLTLGLDQLDPATADGALARTLLARAACLDLAGAAFPRALLTETAPVDQDDPDAELLVDDALNSITDLGFLEIEQGGRLRMHGLIAAAVGQARLVDDPLGSFAPAALDYCVALIAQADANITGGQINAGRALLSDNQTLWSQFLDWSYAHEVGSTRLSSGARHSPTGQLLDADWRAGQG
jgi:hypothetical protein